MIEEQYKKYLDLKKRYEKKKLSREDKVDDFIFLKATIIFLFGIFVGAFIGSHFCF